MMKQQVEDYADESVRDHVRRLAGEEGAEGEQGQRVSPKTEKIFGSIKSLRLLNLEVIE